MDICRTDECVTVNPWSTYVPCGVLLTLALGWQKNVLVFTSSRLAEEKEQALSGA